MLCKQKPAETPQRLVVMDSCCRYLRAISRSNLLLLQALADFLLCCEFPTRGPRCSAALPIRVVSSFGRRREKAVLMIVEGYHHPGGELAVELRG